MNEQDRSIHSQSSLNWSIYNSRKKSDTGFSLKKKHEEEERLQDLFRRYSELSEELESIPDSYIELTLEAISSRYGISIELADKLRMIFVSDIDKFRNDPNYKIYSKYYPIPDAIFKITTNPDEFFINPGKRFTLIASTSVLDDFFLSNGITTDSPTENSLGRIFFGDL